MPIDPFMYAANKALDREPTERQAILCLRELVEDHQTPVEKAILAIYAAFPLGINALGDIADRARQKYGVTT